MSKPWHEEAAEWLEQSGWCLNATARDALAVQGINLVRAALVEREELRSILRGKTFYDAAQAERDAIVAYLRRRAKQTGGDCWCFSAGADEVEAGAHREGGT